MGWWKQTRQMEHSQEWDRQHAGLPHWYILYHKQATILGNRGGLQQASNILQAYMIQYNIDIYTTDPQGGWYIRLILHGFRGRGALLYLKTTDLGCVAWFHYFADAADVLFGWSFGAHFFLEEGKEKRQMKDINNLSNKCSTHRHLKTRRALTWYTSWERQGAKHIDFVGYSISPFLMV